MTDLMTADLVIVVVDGEAVASDRSPFTTEQADTNAMERSDHHVAPRRSRRPAPDAPSAPPAALFVKVTASDLPRSRITVLQQEADALGQHARLAGARTGQNEQRTVDMLDGSALGRIEGFEA